VYDETYDMLSQDRHGVADSEKSPASVAGNCAAGGERAAIDYERAFLARFRPPNTDFADWLIAVKTFSPGGSER